MLELNNIYNLNCVDGLKLLEPDSINCVVTSPPYFGLRQYFGNYLKLKDNLTEKEKIFVLSELKKRNIHPI